MKIGKRLAATGTALGLAVSGLMLGATAAHADGTQCGHYTTKYGAYVSICLTISQGSRPQANLSYYVDSRSASTDEHIYIQLAGCGSSATSDFNDEQNGQRVWNYRITGSCPSGFSNWDGYSYATETGHTTGSTNTGWFS
ncbi:hypothetical protein OHS33_35230 [Streptomyces sp. NBC_00536]|uniref:hypothetical protein n=1 Tax=Streptomyces sp. NBC_00536 TaxID=2975769 RepID=UPI002E81BAD0|nr:hypothetical protein [Streptomyces sp. NBC_00536]WUC83167.1 hypothetical protein OHS33_35230 [Streptomyces sp. NBC_00536]